jgi:hypothetical protein
LVTKNIFICNRENTCLLVSNLTNFNGNFLERTRLISHAIMARGADPVLANQQAYRAIGGMVSQQATLLAHIDNFWLLGMTALGLVPFVFLMKQPKRGGAIAAR